MSLEGMLMRSDRISAYQLGISADLEQHIRMTHPPNIECERLSDYDECKQ